MLKYRDEDYRFTLSKLECLKQPLGVLNRLAWDNRMINSNRILIGLTCSLSNGELIMIKRSSWGHLYFVARGEILGFTKDKPMRKHLSRMFSLIKNES